MGYDVSGHATGIPDATQTVNLLGRVITSGRHFYLKKAWFYKDTLEEARVCLFDLTAQVGAAPSTTALKYIFVLGYGQGQNYNETFEGNGLKFEKGCVAALQASNTSTGITTMGGLGSES